MGAQIAAACACTRGVARLLRGGPAQVADGDREPLLLADPSQASILRVIQITDVYVLENFPHLRTLIKEKRAEIEARGGRLISMLTGDFLAPYLLSSLDKGVGMMNMLNGTPIDYLTWGNHEDDIAHTDVIRREREYQGCWINTNMQSHESFRDSRCQVDAAVIDLVSADGSNSRKVGLIGVLSNSPSLYRPNAFGGATIEDPWETIRTYKAKLEKERGCDLVIPLCHLYEAQDERTCREFDFPLVLSGHDHHVVDREVEGTRLLKPGLDGHQAYMVDVFWPAASSTAPTIQAELLTVKDWPADPELVKEAEKAYSVLDPLRRTQLAKIPAAYRPLTSFNSRGCRVSMGTYLLSRIRDALNMDDAIGGARSCDCAILKGGNVRGGRDYADDEQITLEVLQSELEESKEVKIIPVPGMILKVGLRETFYAPNPGWMQYDDQVILDDDGFVTHIAGEPLDLTKQYKVASISDFWRKRDAPSIGAYFELFPHLLPEQDSGIPWHALLIRFFAMGIWQRIWKALHVDFRQGSIDEEAFRRMDIDGDGKLSREDLKHCVEQVAGLETFAGQDVVVDQMFGEMTTFQRKTSETIHPTTLKEAHKHWSNTSLASMGGDDSSEDDEFKDEQGGQAAQRS